MDMDVSDATLVERTRRGDAAAFDALVRRHLRAAYAVALARVGEPADAEDVCQDGFITALRRIDDCRQPDRFAAWLLRIVRNRAHDQVRGRAVRQAVPLDENSLASTGPDPLREASRAELHGDENRIEVPLARVSPHLRKAIVAFEDQRFRDHRGIDRGRFALAKYV